MHAVAVPTFRHILPGLDGVLDKAAEHANAAGADEGQLLETRFAPDMFPLSRQVQIAIDHAKGAFFRLAGHEVPSFPDEEPSLRELRDRIRRTLDAVKSVPAGELEGSEDREIKVRAGPRELQLDGRTYLLHFALPNFYFQATTAYDILRAQGVPLGKRDFLGAPEGAVPAWLRAD